MIAEDSLNKLFDEVLEDDKKNNKEYLMEAVRKLKVEKKSFASQN